MLYVERQLIGQRPLRDVYTFQFWTLEQSLEERFYPLSPYSKRTTLKGRLSSNTIITTTLDKLIEYGLYRLYPPFADVSERSRLCLRVLQLRETFTDILKEPTDEEVEIAQRISVGCFLHISIRPVIMMTLLSLKPRYRLEPRILKAFKDNCWGTFVSDYSLECYRTTSEHVPEHRQFTDMMHDVHAHTQRERQIERATRDAAKQQKEILDLTTSLGQLHLTRDRSDAGQPCSDTSIISERVDDEEMHQKGIQDVNTGTTTRNIRPPSPKTRMIEMMEEEEEEQQRALDQIEDCYEETRTWLVNINYWYKSFQLVHVARTYDRSGFGVPSESLGGRPALCDAMHSDKTEEEAYWAEVEENAMAGGAGFREPGEPHIHQTKESTGSANVLCKSQRKPQW
ncbi:hypothetical protein BM1_00701 [Bipolaris maydis]|nr:hypothetical protein BM1_00701 [Bipolaris maydis]